MAFHRFTDVERAEAFVAEYEALCRKYNVTIDWCGCCSLWLAELGRESSGSLMENIESMRSAAQYWRDHPETEEAT